LAVGRALRVGSAASVGRLGSVRDTLGASPCWCDGHSAVAGRVGVGWCS
jgi:hypothetical protein